MTIICLIISGMISFYVHADENYETPDSENGIYIISDSNDFLWFADYVSNKGNNNINAKLSADIDLNEVENLCPINNYNGIFDGQGYTIKNINITSSENYAALFGTLSGTVKNLSVNGNIISVGGIAGGIAGQNSGCIENCIFYGKISASTFAGGIAGENDYNGEVLGCCAYITSAEASEIYPITSNSGRIKNCFYNESFGDDGIKKTTAISDESFSNGMLCYTINEVSGENLWSQNLEIEPVCEIPLPSDRYAAVCKTSDCNGNTVYSNYNTTRHYFISDTCSECGTKGISTESASLMLNDSIDMKYYLRINNPKLLNGDVFLEYSYNNDTSTQQILCQKENEFVRSAVIPGDTDKLDRIINTKAYAVIDEKIIYNDNSFNHYSVIDYANEILSDSNGLYNENCKKLILNILNYGCYAQEYSYGNTSMRDTINSKFSDYFNEYSICLPTPEFKDLSDLKVKNNDSTCKIKSLQLILGSKVSMIIKINGNASDYTVRMTDNLTGNVTDAEFSASSEQDIYVAAFSNISAENLLDDFTITVLDENMTPQSNTIGYNIENYIYAISNSDDTNINRASDLSRSLLGYAKSVIEYVKS